MSSRSSYARPAFSFFALTSFVTSFAIARVFTTVFPDTILLVGRSHIHHFWFGLALMAIGGWLGIVYSSYRIDRIAAILYGAGGGLIVDEIGLLVTFGNYYSEITYTAVIGIVAVASILILLFRYSSVLRSEFSEFTRGNLSLYFGVFMGGISLAFILDTDNISVISISVACAIIGALLVVAHFVQHFRNRNNQGLRVT